VDSDNLPKREELKDLFEYRDGDLFRNGKRVGTMTPAGYFHLCFKKKTLYNHRIIWKIHNGKIRKGKHIDHIDGNRSNNRIENLQCVSPLKNCHRRILNGNWLHNTSGRTGVHWHEPSKKWWARISIGGERISLGLFTDKNLAIKSREKAEKLFFRI
jgi:hypothetical protein